MGRRLKSRAFSLVEAVFSCGILALFVVVLFALFEKGFRGFSVASVRMDSATEMQALLYRLKVDCELSTLDGSQVVSNRTANVVLDSGSATYPRHLACLPGLSDWQAPASFDPASGLPRWNRYVLYHSETRPQGAQLLRYELEPPSTFGGFQWNRLNQYRFTFPDQGPVLGGWISNTQVRAMRSYTRSLLGFEASKTSSALHYTIRLRSSTRDATGPRRDEVLEAQLRVVPKNRPY